MSETIEFVKELQALADDTVDPKGKTMDRWDAIRHQVETHKGSDLPRMNLESLMETLSDKIREAASLLDITETSYKNICEMNE